MDLLQIYIYDNILYYVFEKQICIVYDRENKYVDYPWHEKEKLTKVQKINNVFYFYTNQSVYLINNPGNLQENIHVIGYKYFFAQLQLNNEQQVNIHVNELGMVTLTLYDNIYMLVSNISYPKVWILSNYLVISSVEDNLTLLLNIQQYLQNTQEEDFITLSFKCLDCCIQEDQLMFLLNNSQSQLSVVKYANQEQTTYDVILPSDQQSSQLITKYFLDDGSLYVQTETMLLVYPQDLTEPIQISPQYLHRNTFDYQPALIFKILNVEYLQFVVIRQTEASLVYFQDGVQQSHTIKQPFFYLRDQSLSRSELEIRKTGFPSYSIKQQGRFRQLTSQDTRLVSYDTQYFFQVVNEALQQWELTSYDNEDKIKKLVFYLSSKNEALEGETLPRFQLWLYKIKEFSGHVELWDLNFRQVFMLPDSAALFAIVERSAGYQQLLYLTLYDIQHVNLLQTLQMNKNDILSVVFTPQGKYQITIKSNASEIYDIFYSPNEGIFEVIEQQEIILYKNISTINTQEGQYTIQIKLYAEKSGNKYDLNGYIEYVGYSTYGPYKLYESKDIVQDVLAAFYDSAKQQFIYLINIKDEIKLCVYKIEKSELTTLNFECSKKTQIMQYSDSDFVIYNNQNISYLHDGKISTLFESTSYMSVKDLDVIPGLDKKSDETFITLIRALIELEGKLSIYDFLLQKEPPPHRLNKYKKEKSFIHYDHIFAKIQQKNEDLITQQVKLYITCPSEYYLCISAYDDDVYRTQKVVERDIIPLQDISNNLTFTLNNENNEKLLFSYQLILRSARNQMKKEIQSNNIHINTYTYRDLSHNVIFILKISKNSIEILQVIKDYFIFMSDKEAFKRQWKAIKDCQLKSRYDQLVEQGACFNTKNEIQGAVLIQSVLYCFEKTQEDQPLFEMAVYKIDIVSKRAKLVCTKRENINNFLTVIIGNKSSDEIKKIKFIRCYYEKANDDYGALRFNIIAEYQYQHKLLLCKQDYKYNIIDYSVQL